MAGVVNIRSIVALMIAGLLMVAFMAPVMANNDNDCSETGVVFDDDNLTANYINEVPNYTLEVTCDIGIYFDQNGRISNADIQGTEGSAMPRQFGIYVDGASVDIFNSTVSVADDYPHQFISITYQNGANGTVRNNDLSGAHRVGMLIRGDNTDVRVQGNSISGTGAKASGWAENGIQVDQGATVDIRNNTVSGHWWDGAGNWASTGIMLLGSDSQVVNNTLVDNQFSVFVVGDGNRVTGNRSSADIISEYFAWGVLIAGNDNQLTSNQISATDGGAGIYIYPESENNRLSGNRISGFAWGIYDGGEDNTARGNPVVTDAGVEVYTHPVQ